MSGGQLASGDRLETWKEIAAYLGKDVRTVQRWEQAYGLPIHRQPRAVRALPYAYKSELDAWRRGKPNEFGDSDLDTEAPTADPATTAALPIRSEARDRARSSTAIILAFAALLVAAALAIVTWAQRHAANPNVHEVALFTPFVNRTGDPVFDLSLAAGLARELEASGAVSVVSPERVQDTLRLMRHPFEVPLDKPTGIEVCRRDGGIRLLLAGAIDRVSTGYALTVELIRAIPNEPIVTIVDEAADRPHVMVAIRRIAAQIRVRLAEQHDAIDRDSAVLEKVSTPSLDALKLYTEASAALAREQEQIAIELLQQSISVDPGFAMAHSLLAWAISGNDGKPEDIEQSARRGWALTDRSTPAERLFVSGTYHFFANHRYQALADCEALLRLQPTNYWALRMAVTIHQDWHDQEGAAPYIVRLADLRPHDLGANVVASNVLETVVRDRSAAAQYLRRAEELIDEDRGPITWNGAWVRLHPAFDAWLRDDANRASQIVDAFSRDPRHAVVLPGIARFLGYWYIALGRLTDAEAWINRIPSGERRGDVMMLAIARGDSPTVREVLTDFIEGRAPVGVSAVLLAEDVGFPDAPRLVADRIRRAPVWLPYRDVVDGEAAFARGNRAAGLQLLDRTWTDGQKAPEAISFLTAERLARGYEANNDPERAIGILERAGRVRDRAYTLAGSGPTTLYCWMRTQDLLSRLYRKRQRVVDANPVENRLLRLLSAADHDMVMLHDIQQRSLRDRY